MPRAGSGQINSAPRLMGRCI